MTSLELARRVASVASDTKAIDIVILDLRKLTSFTDYFVICSGGSDRQVQAIVHNICDVLTEKAGRTPLSREGEDSCRWVLVDYGDVVAHVFYKDDRLFYQIERLWADAPQVKVSR